MSFSLLSFQTHDPLAKASVLTTKSRFENILQRKINQILKEFYEFLGEFEVKLKRCIVA